MTRCKECGCRHCQCPQVLTDRIEALEAAARMALDALMVMEITRQFDVEIAALRAALERSEGK